MNLSQSMYYTLGREPTLGELAAELAVTPEEIAFAMDAARMPISISTPVAGEGGKELTLGDSITTGDNTAGVVNKVVLREMLSGLPASERQIIVMRYLMAVSYTHLLPIPSGWWWGRSPRLKNTPTPINFRFVPFWRGKRSR